MATFQFVAPASGGESVRLRLEGEVTVESAGELRQALLQALEGGGGIVVDCGGATSIDLSTLQLLCAAHRTAITLGKDLALDGCEDALARAVEEAGFRRQRACLLSPEKDRCLWLARTAG